MTTVVIDDATRDRLRAGDPVVLLDGSGAIVAEARATEPDPSRPAGRWMTDAEAARYVAEELPFAKLVPAAEVEQRLRELRKRS